MSRKSPATRALARADALSTLSLLETCGALAPGDLRQLRLIAEHLDPATHRLVVASALSQMYPGATLEQANTSLRNLRSRLNTAQDAAIDRGEWQASKRLELKRSGKGDASSVWFTGTPAVSAHARTPELPDHNRPRYAGERPAPPLLTNLAIDPENRPVLLLTVNARETDALYDVFSPGSPPQYIDHGDYPYVRFTDAVGHDQRKRRVIAFRCQMGSLRSGAANERVAKAIQHFQPAVVLAVGVGFGRKDKQQFGDVLISQQVTSYESARISRDFSTNYRSETLPAAYLWLERSTQVALPGIHRRTGQVVCGEKLVDNAGFRERLQRDFPLAIGGDMESFGVATACMNADDQLRVGWLMIKGVSDWGDGDKAGVGDAQGDADQYQAAYRAAMAAYSAIHLRAPDVAEPAEACRLWLQRQSGGSPGGLPQDWVTVDAEPAPPTPSAKPRARTQDFQGTRDQHMVANAGVPASQHDRDTQHLTSTHDTQAQAPVADASTRSDTSGPLPIQDSLMGWLQQDDAPPVFALLGEYGMGKTVNCQCLNDTLLEARARGGVPAWQRQPVYFDLRRLTLLQGQARGSAIVLPTVEAMADDLFAHAWDVPAGQRRPGHGELRQWLEEGALLIVDGLDECLVHLHDSQHDAFLQGWLNLLESASKAATGTMPRLLLSCRTNFFKRLSDQRNLFVGMQRGQKGADWYVCRLLLPFTEDQIREYLANVVPEVPVDELLALIDDVHNLRELAERPMTLRFLGEYIPQLEEARKRGATVNGASLYGLVADRWLQRDAGKHHLRPEHKLRLMPALAAHLWRSGVRSLPYDQLHTWFHEWRETQPDLAKRYAVGVYDQEKLEEDLRTATFVVRDDAESREAGDEARAEGFRFAHSSLAEYFLAVYLADAVRDDRIEDWAMPIPSRETLDFLAQKLVLEQAGLPAPRQRDGGLLATLNRWRKTYRAQASELLLRYALDIRSTSLPGALQPALAGFDLRNAQLRGWRFGERFADKATQLLDMAAAQWAGADLRDTRFNHVRLDDGDFSAARADCATFQHCSLQRTQWPQAELPGTVFRHCRLQGSGGVYGGQSQSPALRHRTQFVACSGDEPMSDAVNRPGEPLWLPSGLAAQSASVAQVQQTGWWTPLPQRDDGPGPDQPGPDQQVNVTYTTVGRSARVTHPGAGLALLAASRTVMNSVAVSVDGSRVVSGSSDGRVRVWDALSGECVRELIGHTQSVHSVALSADGGRIVSGSDDGRVRVWDTLSGECVRELVGQKHWVLCFALSMDGGQVVTGSDDGSVRIWNALSGECVRELVGHIKSVHSVAMSADGGRVATVSEDGSVRVWDALSDECVCEMVGHTDWVRSIALSADGGRVASSSDDGTVRVWDASSGECMRELVGHTHWAQNVALSADGGRVVSSSSDGRIRVWDALSGECVREMVGHTRWIQSVALSADGGRVVSGSSNGRIRVWDVSSGDYVRDLLGYAHWVESVALSTDSGQVVTGSDDGSVRVWDALSGECVRELVGHTQSVQSVALSADGSRIVSGSFDGSVRVWDASSGECVREFVKHRHLVHSVALSADGGLVVSGSEDGSVLVWDALRGECVHELVGHKESVQSVALSADGSRVVSGSEDGSVWVWNALSGECLRELVGHIRSVHSVALSADGNRVVTGSEDGSVRVWDALSGECVRELVGHTDWVRSIALSADGGHLVSGSDDGTVRVWDASSGECVRELVGHTHWVLSIALSADGALVSSCADGAVRVFRGPGGRGVLQADGPERLEADLAMFAHDIDGVPSHARWRPAHAQWEGDPLPPDGGELLYASGDAWKVLAWQVFDHPSAPGQWTRIPLQGYE